MIAQLALMWCESQIIDTFFIKNFESDMYKYRLVWNTVLIFKHITKVPMSIPSRLLLPHPPIEVYICFKWFKCKMVYTIHCSRTRDMYSCCSHYWDTFNWYLHHWIDNEIAWSPQQQKYPPVTLNWQRAPCGSITRFSLVLTFVYITVLYLRNKFST